MWYVNQMIQFDVSEMKPKVNRINHPTRPSEISVCSTEKITVKTSQASLYFEAKTTKHKESQRCKCPKISPE